MNHSEFWASIATIIQDGFTPEGLTKLERYAEQFISGQLVYKRFSPHEQHGCATGGVSNVIASLLAGAKIESDKDAPKESDFKRTLQRGTQQAERIERWAKTVGIWIDQVDKVLSQTLGEQIAEGGTRQLSTEIEFRTEKA